MLTLRSFDEKANFILLSRLTVSAIHEQLKQEPLARDSTLMIMARFQ